MASGTVKWFNDEKGFGFVTPDEGGNDAFLHVSDLPDGGRVAEGQRVEFELTQGAKGLRAKSVRVLSG